MDADIIRTLNTLSRDQAFDTALKELESIKSGTKTSKFLQLQRDLKSARDSQEIQRIMYQVLLAGDGLRTLNSAWHSRHVKT